ncbi:AraC family transcriptional regulator of adaptative response/methylated-DNA-[protein]-cysteine methyltransferase [Microvirga flocculans]|uniref:methylated-DNA--[protein]-cysteine S-methyltransferase n=2 Tax=Microvirga flocculans TaxID=217168 RepID=A0A7W6ID08_9HYPH|nr:trifunctional transcriptional activator/DNA repair protein Ada/methylated-DNA--[protein]-cysteine S-methyltransferase [Microvirga flocculans]MBB4039218.1 AraC family transcriptional regulator of adaptative response/methylated-DNA-[protein]-cysteine methyltransferase [Microvirga flocculans]
MLMLRDDDTLFAALLARDPSYEGFAYVGVKTTGIFCRLTCPARKPKRDNVVFFSCTDAAQGAGFRACLRCKPLDSRRPASGALDLLRDKVKAEPDRRWTTEELKALGYDPSTVRRAFQREYGMTFAQYARSQRLGHAVSRLKQGGSVLEAQLDAGYESGSGFRDAIGRLIGDAPARTTARQILTAQWLDTPIGAMLAVADDAGVHLLEFAERKALPNEIKRLREQVAPIAFGRHPMIDTLADEVRRYFAGQLAAFTVPVVQKGTAFEATVWDNLRRIPVGQTRSYGALARTLGRPDSARAVARANGANQIAIIVPCHRVIGADGSLTGYGGKLWRKQWLLEHERRMADAHRTPASAMDRDPTA